MKKKNVAYLILFIAIVVVVMTSAVIILTVNLAQAPAAESNCQYIYGDGYHMGTDPEPVVIGGSCDGVPLTEDQIDALQNEQN